MFSSQAQMLFDRSRWKNVVLGQHLISHKVACNACNFWHGFSIFISSRYDMKSSPPSRFVLYGCLVFWTKHDTSSKIYSTFLLISIIATIQLTPIITVCLLNLHKDERMKPKTGTVEYDESRDLGGEKGFDSTSAAPDGQSAQRKP
jgi:hypothetical protein